MRYALIFAKQSEVNVMPKQRAATHVRDAKTGRFLPKGTDKKRPATTIKETVKLCKPRRK